MYTMSKENLIKEVNESITRIKSASKITRKETQAVVISFLSLNHMGSLDVIPHLATRMVGALTTLESTGFRIFIETMFPLKWKDGEKLFDDIPVKNKEVKQECKRQREIFLSEYDNNYWLWLQRNVKAEVKNVDYMARLDSAFSSALNPEKGDASMDEVLSHIIDTHGLSIDTFMQLLVKNVPVIEAIEVDSDGTFETQVA